MELLRIIAAIMVILYHSNMRIFGLIEGGGFVQIGRSLIDAITVVNVNVFVLITGYFGTSLKPAKVLMIIYTLLFAILPLGFIYIIWGNGGLNSLMEHSALTFWKIWFVNAYIGLLCFVPILNKGLDSISKREYQVFLLMAIIVLGTLDYFIGMFGVGYEYGLSVIWLICMYCLGRYIRKYKYVSLSFGKFFLLFSVGVILQTILTINHRYSGYTSPVCVLTSVGFFMMFTHLKFQSKVVNYVAASSLMIILFHMSPVGWGAFKALNYHVAENYPPAIAAMMIFVICIGFAVVGFAYDQLRKLSWRWLSPLADSISRKYQDWVNHEPA